MNERIETVEIKQGRFGLIGMTFEGGLDSRVRQNLFFPDKHNPGRFSEARVGELWQVRVLFSKNNLNWCRFVESAQEAKARESAESEKRSEDFTAQIKKPRISFDGRGWKWFNLPGKENGFTIDESVATKLAADFNLKI